MYLKVVMIEMTYDRNGIKSKALYYEISELVVLFFNFSYFIYNFSARQPTMAPARTD